MPDDGSALPHPIVPNAAKVSAAHIRHKTGVARFDFHRWLPGGALVAGALHREHDVAVAA